MRTYLTERHGRKPETGIFGEFYFSVKGAKLQFSKVQNEINKIITS